VSLDATIGDLTSGGNMPPPVSPALGARVLELWQELGREVEVTGVVCRQSGNCCNFDEWEHVAFATTVELRMLMTVPMPLEPGERSAKLCPYWLDRKCTAHHVRPLGCRVFFCDQTYGSEHAQRIYERHHARMKAICEEFGEPYAYVPMVAAMREWVKRGRFFDPERPFALLVDG
jgi:Fe-S-cluster containining protein